MVAPTALPYASPMGLVYDSGAFAENMDLTLALADWDGFDARRRAVEAGGRLLGRGEARFTAGETSASCRRTRSWSVRA